MNNFQRNKKWLKVAYSVPVLFLVFVILAFFSINVLGFVGKVKETTRNRKVAEQKLNELEKQKEELALIIDKLNSPDGVEEVIREKYGLAKEGEGVIVIVDEDAQSVPDESGSKGLNDFLKKVF